MAHYCWVGKADLVSVQCTRSSRDVIRALAKARRRRIYQQVSWMADLFTDAGDVAMLSVPVRLVDKLTRVANAFRRSPLDQLEWMLDRELTKRADLVRELEKMKEVSPDGTRRKLIIGGIEEADRKLAMGA